MAGGLTMICASVLAQVFIILITCLCMPAGIFSGAVQSFSAQPVCNHYSLNSVSSNRFILNARRIEGVSVRRSTSWNFQPTFFFPDKTLT